MFSFCHLPELSMGIFQSVSELQMIPFLQVEAVLILAVFWFLIFRIWKDAYCLTMIFLCLIFVLKDIWTFRARVVQGERINL